jgi:hypothetical protein
VTHLRLPPRAIGGMRTVCFARLSDRTHSTGMTRHSVSGNEAARFSGLVIVEEGSGGAHYLLYCDDEWAPITDTWHESIARAKEQAAFEYKGIEGAWEELPSHA